MSHIFQSLSVLGGRILLRNHFPFEKLGGRSQQITGADHDDRDYDHHDHDHSDYDDYDHDHHDHHDRDTNIFCPEPRRSLNKCPSLTVDGPADMGGQRQLGRS